MPKSRHDKIVKILYQISKQYKHYERVYADHISKDYRSISILTQVSKREAAKTYPYFPDLFCKYKRGGRIDVFEVWDSQSEADCVEDILFSALSPNINCLSIICFRNEDYDLAIKLVDIILHPIYNEEGKHFLCRQQGTVLISLVPEKLLNNDGKLKAFLYKDLKFNL